MVRKKRHSSQEGSCRAGQRWLTEPPRWQNEPFILSECYFLPPFHLSVPNFFAVMIYVVLLGIGSIQIKKSKSVKKKTKWRSRTESILMKTCLRSTLKLIMIMCFSYFQLFGLCLCVNQITFSYFPRTAKYCTENICSFMDLVESSIYPYIASWEKRLSKFEKKSYFYFFLITMPILLDSLWYKFFWVYIIYQHYSG